MKVVRAAFISFHLPIVSFVVATHPEIISFSCMSSTTLVTTYVVATPMLWGGCVSHAQYPVFRGGHASHILVVGWLCVSKVEIFSG
jgi:hypothetical protein